MPSIVQPFNASTSKDNVLLRKIDIPKLPNGGLGFNIVGGSNSEHIPGDKGIFITSIKPGGSSAKDGRLAVGDRIVMVNTIDLTDVTHEQAVEALHSVKAIAQLTIEKDGELNALKQDSFEQPEDLVAQTLTNATNELNEENVRPSTPPKSTGQNKKAETLVPNATGPTESIKNNHNEKNEHKPIISYASSAVDDEMATTNVITEHMRELVYVSVGAAAVIVGAYVIYRYVKKN